PPSYPSPGRSGATPGCPPQQRMRSARVFRRDQLLSNKPGSGLRSRVALAAEDVQRDVRLVADHPAVVAGRYVEEVPRPHHDLAAVVHLRNGPAAQDQADVLDLARALAGGWADVLRPLPPGLVGRPAEGGRPDDVELEAALLERAHLGRAGEGDELEGQPASE